jgi:hypothetical protein
MTCDICSASSADPVYPLIGASEFWTTELAPNQSLLGRYVVAVVAARLLAD